MTERFEFMNKEDMSHEVVNTAKSQWPNLQKMDNNLLLNMVRNCIDEIESLHNTLDIVSKPPVDIDIIWGISAPGWLMKEGSISGWSSSYPQLNNCEKEVSTRTIDLELAISARRLNKSVNEVTREDVLKYGPMVIYNGPLKESEDFTQFLESIDRIPLEKAYIFHQVTTIDPVTEGQIIKDITNTFDQAQSINMPVGICPRKIAISVLAAQWVRLGRLLQKSKTLPVGIPIVLIPTPSPKGFEREHAIMESRGALINAYEHQRASVSQIPYVLYH